MGCLVYVRWHADLERSILYKVNSFRFVSESIQSTSILDIDRLGEEKQFFKLVLCHVSKNSILSQNISSHLQVSFYCFIYYFCVGIKTQTQKFCVAV